MNNNVLQIKFKERLNKLASDDYDNIECWQIAEAFNKSALEWTRRQINGINQRQEGDEATKQLIDDLQVLLRTSSPLTVTKFGVYYESTSLPSDYLGFKRVDAYAVTECCDPRSLKVYLAENADVNDLLADDMQKPSVEWGETFCTLQGNVIRIYTNDEFEISKPYLMYYKKPREVQFDECYDMATGTQYTADVESEFKDDIVELIIDDAASTLAFDMENVAQGQIRKQSSSLNT